MTKNWRFEDAVTSFGKYKENWQQLNKTILACEHPLLHVDYVEPLIRYFAPSNLILALQGSSGEDGMVLLHKKQWGVWESFCPPTGPFSWALIKEPHEGYTNASISSLIRSLPGYAGLFAFYKLDPDFLTVKTSNDKGRIEKRSYMETIRVPVDRSFEEYWKARGRNLRRDIIKKMRRIEKSGIEVDFRELRLPDEMHAGVETYGNLESSGWKGEMDTAVHIDNHRGRFYVEMLGRFALREKAAIYQLLFNGQVVASALTIRGGGMIIILKITYSENMKKYSPGLVMYYELHKKIFSTRKIDNIEYYGRATQRAKQWGGNVRTIYHLNYYRTPLTKNLIHLARKFRDLAIPQSK